jgi:hypothetical protein
MSASITWGLSSDGKCKVFCFLCRKVFGENLDPVTARELKQDCNCDCKDRPIMGKKLQDIVNAMI